MKPLPPLRSAFVLLVACTSTLFGLDDPLAGQELDVALSRAGDNRHELETAVTKAPTAHREAMEFLVVNMPQRDLETLSAEFLLENVAYAYRAFEETPWKDRMSNEMFLNDILPYANISERRDNWRKDFYERFSPIVKDCKSPGEAGHLLNQTIFKQLGIKFNRRPGRADQSPYETLEAHVASCSGLSIFLVNACRAVGVPARFAGTPMWTSMSGNHSWVEIWDDDGWHFTGAAEAKQTGLDHAWFTKKTSLAIRDSRIHAIYAASFRKTPIMFPAGWTREKVDHIYAVNVTDRYTKSAPPAIGPKESLVSICVIDKPDGIRVVANVRIVREKDNAVVFQGKTKGESSDSNDHMTLTLPLNEEVRIELSHGDWRMEERFSPTNAQPILTFAMSSSKRVMP
jgi:hypothetical protein